MRRALHHRRLRARTAAGLVGLANLLTQATASASEPAPADSGFSYFMGLGRQSVTYRETGSSLPFRSEAKATNPLLITGALYGVTDRLLFSVDSETTIAPGRSTEVWSATAPTFNGITLTSPVLQRNGFSLNQTNLQLLGHYRVAGPWFASAGFVARTLAFQRFSFVAGPDNAVSTPTGTTVEENAAELMLQLGAALESERVRKSDSHYSLRALAGVPVWRRVQNTSVPELSFDKPGGWDLALEGRYSMAVRDSVHVGLWGKWSVTHRPRQTLGLAELPLSRMTGFNYGIELLWKL